ncbi:MAG TPA: HAD hydrolase family protein [Chthonomonadales bacterium]|nr:HAD hydrolase family protein [Chthonomonadales bacterium]
MLELQAGSDDLRARLAAVRLLAMDVDGVLTDGGIMLADDEVELKRFHVVDGMGLRLAMLAGLTVAWVSGRESVAVERRARELDVVHLLQGVSNKERALATLTAELGVDRAAVAYIGDDWNDLPAFSVSGVRFAPASAPAEIKGAVDMVTECAGGQGAVREVCDLLLRAQGKYHAAVEAYLQEARR